MDEAERHKRRFQALVDAHSAFVWTTDAAGVFVEPQPGWAAYTGQTFEEYSVRGGFAALHPDDRERVWQRWSLSTQERVRYEIDMRLWHAPTGSWRWCTLRAVPVLDDAGNIIEWVGSAIDIDESRRQEIELRESERRFRSIMERVQAVGLMLDERGRVTFANDFLLKLTGWSREEVIGEDYFERFIDPNCFIRPHFYDAIKNGDIFHHAENEILTRRGERRMLAWDNTVLRDSEGRVVGTASIGRDVTERYRAEKELKESQERLQLALSASNTGIWDADLIQQELHWSDECFSIFGISREEFDGKVETFWRAVHPEDRDRVSRAFAAFIAGREAYTQEYRIVRPDGEIRWITNLGAILDDEEHPMRVTGTVIDITSRKQTEEALRKAERFAAAGRMAATVAHEINNPLASLVNVLYLLQAQDIPDSAKELLQIAAAELNRVVRISKQTLGFYQGSKVPAAIEMASVIENVKASFEAVAAKRGITLVSSVRGPIPTLHGFADEIRQVLINLLTNAIESGATKVLVRVRSSHGGRHYHREGVRLSVIEDGKGIARENLGKLFEPFFTTKGEKGTGLGLWVSRGIIMKHEGEITVRSSTREGRNGTCVSVFLPTGTARSKSASGENQA